jgi:hypothetical protein
MNGRITVRPEEIAADTKAWLEEIAASHKETVAESKPKKDIKTTAYQEMEARQDEKKPTSMDMKPEAAQREEVPVDDAKVMPVGEPKNKRRRDRKLAAERRRQKPKDKTREKCGSQKRLAVPRRRTSRRAKLARKTNRQDVPSRNSGTTQERHREAVSGPGS